MGRDDARPVGGLQGGTAPARAFHDFMVRAVARRPAEPFETEVPMPDWQLEPEEDVWAVPGEGGGMQPMVDADGNPLPGSDPYAVPQQPAVRPDGTGPDQQWLDDVLGSGRPPQPQPQPQPFPPGQRPPPPPPRSVPPADALEPRPDPSQ
jgi:penicillin-binding protein 1A